MTLINWKTKQEIQEKIKPLDTEKLIKDIQEIVGDKIPISIDSDGNLEIEAELTPEQKTAVLNLL